MLEDWLDSNLKSFKALRPLRLAKRSVSDYLHKRKCLAVRQARIHAYLDSHVVRKLQIGSYDSQFANQFASPEWLNTDLWPRNPQLVHLDATLPFPFENEVLDYVFSEHVIEHLSHKDGLSMLTECFRVLKPGGKIRIATPDLEKFLSFFRPDIDSTQQAYIEWMVDSFVPSAREKKEKPVFVLNNLFRNWGHQFVYTKECLLEAFQSAGFSSMRFFNVGESDDPHLQGIEVHGKLAQNEQANAYETMILQGRKPV